MDDGGFVQLPSIGAVFPDCPANGVVVRPRHVLIYRTAGTQHESPALGTVLYRLLDRGLHLPRRPTAEDPLMIEAAPYAKPVAVELLSPLYRGPRVARPVQRGDGVLLEPALLHELLGITSWGAADNAVA